MDDSDRPLTATSNTPQVNPEEHFGGIQGTLYSEKPPEFEAADIWSTAQHQHVPKSTSRGFLNMAIGIPLAIVLFAVVTLVVVAIAFGTVGAIGNALGLSPSFVAVAAIIVALLVLGAIFNQLGLF